MSVGRAWWLVLGLVLVAPAVPAWADDDDDDDDDEEEAGDEDEDAEDGDKSKAKPDEPFVKQNLSGHDLGTSKKENVFEKDRFFVDKADSEKTAKGTLIQGSLSSSSFLYAESGSTYEGTPMGVTVENAALFSRVFTELRLQTDFRHIKGSQWEARVDARARVVNTPSDGAVSADPNRIQAGFRGTSEYDIRELWLYRSGKRTDLFFGRQFVPDLGGIKFDGLRFDYAKSRTITLIGFGGLYPMRGSRSLTTDYPELRGNSSEPAGKFVGAAGFGGAYRTDNAYGAVGGVALAPLSTEEPRVFVTSTGYWRKGATLDIYHFALVDLVGSQGAGLTNLSAGLNYKPSPRLRVTGGVNRVDVDTLGVQANAYLTEPQLGGAGDVIVQNETYFRRLATNVGRVGVSAGLGEFSRFELSTAVSYRYRPSVSIPIGNMAMTVPLQGTRGIELWAAFVDRRSFKDLRLGGDITRTIGLGGDNAIAFNRSEILSVRAFASRALKNGHGEWEAEVSRTTTKDSASGFSCINVYTCYGSSTGAIIALGGNLYYRINRDWFLLGHLQVTRQTLDAVPVDAMGNIGTIKEDPSVLGLSGYFRAAYRF